MVWGTELKDLTLIHEGESISQHEGIEVVMRDEDGCGAGFFEDVFEVGAGAVFES